MGDQKLLTVRMSAKEFDAVGQLADELGVSKSDLVRDLVEAASGGRVLIGTADGRFKPLKYVGGADGDGIASAAVVSADGSVFFETESGLVEIAGFDDMTEAGEFVELIQGRFPLAMPMVALIAEAYNADAAVVAR